MTVPLRTRADLKAAGRAFADQAADLFGAAIMACPDAQRTEAHVDALQARTLAAMEDTAASYQRLGFPPAWGARFRSAFLRTFRDRCALMSITARADGRPN